MHACANWVSPINGTIVSHVSGGVASRGTLGPFLQRRFWNSWTLLRRAEKDGVVWNFVFGQFEHLSVVFCAGGHESKLGIEVEGVPLLLWNLFPETTQSENLGLEGVAAHPVLLIVLDAEGEEVCV